MLDAQVFQNWAEIITQVQWQFGKHASHSNQPKLTSAPQGHGHILYGNGQCGQIMWKKLPNFLETPKTVSEPIKLKYRHQPTYET